MQFVGTEIVKLHNNKEICCLCEEFASNMMSKDQSASYYESNRKASVGNAITNIYEGKRGEFFAKAWFESKGLNCEVDMEIRKGRNKGWVPDLIVENKNVHVKTCSRKTFNLCNDYSFTFQWSNVYNKGGRDPIFDNLDDYFLGVYVENTSCDTAEIKLYLPVSNIMDKLKDPKLPKFIGIKKCIYFEDFVECLVT